MASANHLNPGLSRVHQVLFLERKAESVCHRKNSIDTDTGCTIKRIVFYRVDLGVANPELLAAGKVKYRLFGSVTQSRYFMFEMPQCIMRIMTEVVVPLLPELC